MTSSASPRQLTQRQIRTLQRTAHMLAGALMVAYVYAAPVLGGGFVTTVRWVIVPAAVASGLALWKWARIRALLRQRER